MTFEARGKHVRLPAEVRAEEDGVLVEGYAAVFDEETDIGGMFREKIERGAFKDAVREDDVVFLINHEGLPLARTRSGTLQLEEDERGLKISTRLASDDPDAERIIPKMKRGDLDKMSFAFMVEQQQWDDTGDMPLRTIQKAKLHDVSVVTTPAYEGTEVGLRSLDDYRKTIRQKNFSATRKRLRMKRDLELTVRENG